MPARKYLYFSKSSPSYLRSPQAKIPTAAAKSRVEERQRDPAGTQRTLNVYENTGSYRFFRAILWLTRRLPTLKIKGLPRTFIGYRNDKKKGC
jgi:hypothetical protein